MLKHCRRADNVYCDYMELRCIDTLLIKYRIGRMHCNCDKFDLYTLSLSSLFLFGASEQKPSRSEWRAISYIRPVAYHFFEHRDYDESHVWHRSAYLRLCCCDCYYFRFGLNWFLKRLGVMTTDQLTIILFLPTQNQLSLIWTCYSSGNKREGVDIRTSLI